jgi:phage/plasmid-like protein (TIGR03299 family)
MSHLVENMFSVREMPWMGLIPGVTVLPEYPGSWAQARVHAGLEWEPVEDDVYRKTGTKRFEVPQLEPWGMDGEDVLYKVPTVEVVEVPEIEQNTGHKHIVRSDTGAILAVNSKGYTIIDNTEMGRILEAVLGTSTNIKYETAGCLDGGKMVWALAMLDEPIELPGESSPTFPYLAMTNRHDGTGACTLRATAVRIVCANTFNAAEAEGERTGTTFSFQHSKNWKERIEDAKAAVTGARTQMQQYVELATDLLATPFTQVQRERFITAFIPTPPAGAVTDRVMANTVESQNRLRQLFFSKTTIEVADTAYGALQAGVEYLDHLRGARSIESRFRRTMISPEPGKRRALKLIREIVAAGV